MQGPRALLLTIIFALTAAVFSSASDIYLAQSAAGGATGADCADALPVTFFNAAGNWGSGTGKIGPGTTVHLCGTLTAAAGSQFLTFQGNGSSGSPITLLFEAGASLQAPYFSSGGAIALAGHSFLVVDGGTNGFIENTLNGSSGAACPGGACSFQQASKAIEASSASNVEIQNLGMKYLYYHATSSDTAIDDSAVNCVYTNGIGNNLSIHNITAVDASWCINLQFGSGSSGLSIYDNSISRIDHGIALGGNPGGALSNVNIYGNTIFSFANWDTTSDDYHHDGIHAYGNSSTITNLNIYNNTFSGPASTCASSCITGYIFIEVSAGITNESIFNNLFTAQSTDIISSGGGLLGVYSGNSPVLIANNTVVGGGSGSALCFGANQTMTGVTLENNVFSTCNQLSDIKNVSFSAFTNNVYANAQSSNALECGSTFYSSSQFAAFKSCAAEGSASIYTANAELNANGTPASGSPVIGAGANLTALGIAALNSDKNATARPSTGPWDVGAFQFSSSPSTAQPPAPPTGLNAVVQ